MRKSILIIFALIVGLVFVQGQPTNPMQQKLPIDPNVRYGQLENGMTYYIRHNKYPEKRADFYIAQKVGSMQEEDNQAGLAHFLEHMAFNGTKHFPGRKTMLNYLETIGAKFGANVNAYTSFDETVYTLSNIPMVRQGIIDSTLLVLHDWSSYIELNNEEIDKERAIIKEEWRTRSGSSYRIWEKQLPTIFEGSKYADRLPIGKMDVVEIFEYQVIKDYYHKWYRPDLQAIIVVGDIDAEKVEAQVKELFSKIPMPENAAERIYHSVPDNDAPIISIVSDKEETSSRVTYYIKHEPIPAEIKHTEMGYAMNIALELATSMLRDRLSNLSKTPESPFTDSYTYNGDFFVSKTKEAWTTVAMSKEGQENETLAALVRETERAKRFGFTDSELERAKANMMKYFEQSYNNRDKQQNNSYVREYVTSFSDNEPIPGIEYEYKMLERLLPSLSSEMINGIVASLLTDNNNIYTITAPQKDDLVLPTKEKVLATISAVRAEKIEGYVEELITEPLISTVPKAGSVVKEEYNKALDMTTWTLSNGMVVSYKTTDFKDDEIMMISMSYGGQSLSSSQDIHNASFANYVPYLGGIGNFNSTDLKKVLAGKNANVNVSISEWMQMFNGRSSVKDVETLMQLTHLYFTAPRKDEGMFTNLRLTVSSQIKNLENNPNYNFQQHVTFARNGTNPRLRAMKAEDVNNLDYDKMMDFYKKITANPGSFSFTFVGNVDKAILKPLVETYLASLPAGDKDATYNKEINLAIRKGNYQNIFDEKMVEPKTTAFMAYSGTVAYTKENLDKLSALKQVLDIVYVRTIREEEGGTYGVGVGSYIKRIPEGEAVLYMSFDTDAEKIKTLAPLIHSELEKIANEGPTDEDFQKVKEYMQKAYEEQIKTNQYWLSAVQAFTFYDGYDSHTPALESIKKMTKADIQKFAKDLISQGNTIEVIMNPLKE